MRQKRLAAKVGDRIWWVDPQNGVARLYTRQREPSSGDIAIQVLGSQAVAEGYWLWEWANPLNVVPPHARRAADALRNYGENSSIEELVTSEVAIDNLSQPDTYAAIAVATLDAPGYFIHTVGGGKLRIPILVDETFRTPDDEDFIGFANTINEVAAAGLPVSNARDLIEGYLDALGISSEALPDGNLLVQTTTQRMHIRLDGGSFAFDVTSRA